MDLGQLATIAVVPTFLNYFLEKDLEQVAQREATIAVRDSRQAAIAP